MSFNRFLQNVRSSSQIVRLKVEGPINNTSELELTQRLNRIQQIRSDALLVVINSFGGSLQSAKNIAARIKKLSLNKQIPVYCFAEEFCLNSANLILTTGTKCFAHKFSIIGDFGFVYEGIDTQELQKSLGVGQSLISTMPKQYKPNWLTQNIMPNDPQLVTKLLKQSEQNLKKQMLQNRFNSLNKLQQQSFFRYLEEEGFCNLNKSIDAGLIDGVLGIEEWILQNQKGKRIIQGTGQQFQNPFIQYFRTLKDSFRFKADHH